MCVCVRGYRRSCLPLCVYNVHSVKMIQFPVNVNTPYIIILIIDFVVTVICDSYVAFLYEVTLYACAVFFCVRFTSYNVIVDYIFKCLLINIVSTVFMCVFAVRPYTQLHMPVCTGPLVTFIKRESKHRLLQPRNSINITQRNFRFISL
jgi:hypothetical protein